MNNKLIENKENLLIYKNEEGNIIVDAILKNDTLWLTQKGMSKVFDCSIDNISLHLKNIFKDNELDENLVTEKSSITASDGKNYQTKIYNLDAIISVGYRINSKKATEFRIWATKILKEYMIKGFALNDERFIKGNKYDAQYFDELLERIKTIRTSERMAYVVNEEKQNAVPIEFYGSTLDECVESLLKFQKRGESVVVEFNGHKLYSADISMDGAYQEVLGMTKAEHEQKMEEWRKEYQEKEAREEAEAKAKIPAWVEKGEALIYPERMEKWKECVEARAGDLYHGMDLDSALALMEKLESGATMEEVKEMFDEQGHSGASAGMVRRMMFHFAKRGPEFYESTAWGELSDEDKKLIEDKKRENAELEELHKTDSTKEVPAERRAEEKGIVDSSSEKAQLTFEIGDIEQQLEELRAKEAELKKALEEKQSKLNGLEEK